MHLSFVTPPAEVQPSGQLRLEVEVLPRVRVATNERNNVVRARSGVVNSVVVRRKSQLMQRAKDRQIVVNLRRLT